MLKAKVTNTVKIVTSVAIITTLFLVAWMGALLLYPASPNYDKVIARNNLGSDAYIIGYRNNVGGATVPFSYDFFILTNGSEPEDSTPFLSTRTPEVDIKKIAPYHIAVEVRGDVTNFHNRVWLHGPEKEPIPVNIDFQAHRQL